MAKSLTIDIPHTLAVEEASRRLAAAAPRLEEKYGATCSWIGDRQLTVSRTGLRADVRIEPGTVHAELEIGLLLSPFANAIKTGITDQLTKILT